MPASVILTTYRYIKEIQRAPPTRAWMDGWMDVHFGSWAIEGKIYKRYSQGAVLKNGLRRAIRRLGLVLVVQTKFLRGSPSCLIIILSHNASKPFHACKIMASLKPTKCSPNMAVHCHFLKIAKYGLTHANMALVERKKLIILIWIKEEYNHK